MMEELTNDEISRIKESYETEEILDEKKIAELIQKRNNSGINVVLYSELFLFSYDIINNNLYLITDSDLKKKVEGFLRSFKFIAKRTRELLEMYNNSVNSSFKYELIKEFVYLAREKMNVLINIFFSIFSGGMI